MNNLVRINSVMDYIEENLAGVINLNDISKIACCSTYNFQRMFSTLANVPLSEYIRNRRLTQAALDLQQTKLSVIDTAVKYGYNSPTAFTRAFQAYHGITPSEAKKEGATLKVFPRIFFTITVRGGRELKYRIENMDGFDVFGIEVVASTKSEDGYREPSRLWSKSLNNGDYDRLMARTPGNIAFLKPNSCKIHGVVNHRYLDEEHFTYMLCSFVDTDTDTSGYMTAHIPDQTYAIFTSDEFEWYNSDMLQKCVHKAQHNFYAEWLPTVSYEKTNGPEFEIYYGVPNNPQMGYIELWYPIKKLNVNK